MITKLNQITTTINGGQGWFTRKIQGREIWIARTKTCSACGEYLETRSITCPKCNAFVVHDEDLYMHIPEAYQEIEDLDKGIEPIHEEETINKIVYIEHSPYRFDILAIKIHMEGVYRFKDNPYRISDEDRIAGISYDTGLRAHYYTSLENIKATIEFISCFSYDINKKPGQRLTLEVGEVGNFVDINKKTLASVYPDDRCQDVKIVTNTKTSWIIDKINNASSTKTLKNTLASFEEPGLKTELAIKHNLHPREIVVKNVTATTLHEILGVSKAYLKFITKEEADKKSYVMQLLKKNDKKFMFKVYHEVGDKYKEFYSVLEKYEANSDVVNLNAYQNSKELLTFFKLGFNMNRLYEYLTEECVWQQGLKPQTALNELYDYVNMCEQLELKDYDRYPKALRTRHDVMTMRYNSVKMNDKQQTCFKDVVEKYKPLEYKDKNYLLRIAKNPLELVYEGSELNHCVGSYADRMADESSIIFFLRNIEAPDKPLATIEIKRLGNDAKGYTLYLGDCRGAFNRKLDSKERAFITKFKKKILTESHIDDFGKLIINKPEKKMSQQDKAKVLLENADTIVAEDEVLQAAAN